jgi:hypothetical protein
MSPKVLALSAALRNAKQSVVISKGGHEISENALSGDVCVIGKATLAVLS